MPRKRSEFGRIKKNGKKFYAYCPGLDGKLNHSPGYGFKTRKAAQLWLDQEEEHLEACRKGYAQWIPPKDRQKKLEADAKTVGQLLNSYYSLEKPGKNWDPVTLAKYREQVKNRITGNMVAGKNCGELQHVPLKALKRQDIIAWWKDIGDQFGADDHTNYKAYERLRQALRRAVVDEDIEENFAVGLEFEKPSTEDPYCPTDAEIYAIIGAVPARYEALAVVTFAHGLRVGEAVALCVDDFDFEWQEAPWLPKVTISIWKDVAQLKDGNGSGYRYYKTPKSPAAVRKVPVLTRFVPTIIAHMTKYAAQRGEELAVATKWGTKPYRFMFPTKRGAPVHVSQFEEDVREARRRVGVSDKITPHRGRNWLVTKLLDIGVPPNQIMGIIGHEDESMVMKYARKKAKEDESRSSIDKLNKELTF